MKKILALILVLILALPLMASAVAESGQVVLSVGSAFTTFFNPYFQGTMIGYAFPCYEPLAWLHSANHEFEAVLAESWEVNKDEYFLPV